MDKSDMAEVRKVVQGVSRQRSARDPRIDLLRGFALITIFVDHVPANPLNMITMRNFGFADAAELFVILAGISSMMAYGRYFEREGARSGSRHVALRCLRIYVFQIALLLTALAIVHQWLTHFGLEPVNFAAFFDDPFTAIGQALALHALPASLNILPLYVVLLALFPLIYAGIRYVPSLTLITSSAVWLIANADHDFNLTNWLDGQGWFFNPFAWQFLFTIGVLGAVVLRANGGELPRARLLTIASWTYLGVALGLSAPWAAWGLSDFHLVDFDSPDKTNLSPLRVINILALLYLALSSSSLRRLAGQRWARLMLACGKHSLEVFSFSTLIALVFRLLFRTYSASWPLQILVNVVGIGAIFALALWLERRSAGVRPARIVPHAAPVS